MLNSNMCNLYPDEYVMRMLWMFMTPYISSSPDNTVYMAAFKSKELYYYTKFKKEVPKELREEVDIAVAMYDHPFTEDWITCDTEIFDETCDHIVTVLVESAEDYKLEDVRPFWKEARDYLAGILPEIREKYYPQATMLAPVSGSQPIFFAFKYPDRVCLLYHSVPYPVSHLSAISPAISPPHRCVYRLI